MSQITIFTSPTCGRCKVLKKKMEILQIPFEETSKVEEIENLGFLSLPIMKVEDKYFDFSQSMQFIENFREGKGA